MTLTVTGLARPQARRVSRRSAVTVALVGLSGYVALALLCAAAWGPDWFVRFGADSPLSDHADQLVGREVSRPFDEGHDGTAFWLLAHDPLLLDVDDDLALLDRPAYRAQRIGYPLLAAPWGLAGEGALLWGLVITNLLAVGAGTYLTARLAERLGAPPVLGLLFAANPVVLLGVMMDLAEVVALAGAVGVLLGVRTDRWAVAVGAACVSALTKESMLLVVACVALGAAGPIRRRIGLVAVPVAAVVAWGVYQRTRLGWPPTGLQELAPAPLSGFIRAGHDVWGPAGRWVHGVTALILLALVGWALLRWWQRRTLELWACLPAVVLVFSTEVVLHLSINAVRTVSPLLTLALLDRAVERWGAGGRVPQPVPAI